MSIKEQKHCLKKIIIKAFIAYEKNALRKFKLLDSECDEKTIESKIHQCNPFLQHRHKDSSKQVKFRIQKPWIILYVTNTSVTNANNNDDDNDDDMAGGMMISNTPRMQPSRSKDKEEEKKKKKEEEEANQRILDDIQEANVAKWLKDMDEDDEIKKLKQMLEQQQIEQRRKQEQIKQQKQWRGPIHQNDDLDL